jgi:hypothetical protein
MDEQKSVEHEKIIDSVVDAYLSKYYELSDDTVKYQLCDGCMFKSNNCFRCEAATYFENNLINEALSEVSRWN